MNWNVRSAQGNVSAVEIWVGASYADLKSFSTGGANGKAKTGAWTRLGTLFVLRNKADD